MKKIPKNDMGKFSTFTKLPFQEKLAFAEASLLLSYARVLVNFVRPKRWRKQIDVKPHNVNSPEPLSKLQSYNALMVMRTIRRVDRNVPVEFVCLPQALTARWMLSRRGVSTEMFIGTKREAEEAREFHAWLKAGEMMVTGHCNERDYVVFGSQKRV